MIDQYTAKLNITIRLCEQADLAQLEWFGTLTPYRETILQAFERQEKGEVIMLVAEANQFPVGQVWLDLTKLAKDSIGVLWALRVLRPFQKMGIGSRLLAAAEKILAAKGFAIAELGVEKDNVNAKRLYERRGYQVVRDVVDEWSYTTPAGEQVTETAIEWMMHKKL